MSGAELGFLSADAAPKWTARLMDAAGIEWEHVDVSSSLEVELEADDIGSEESSDGSEG